MKTVALPLNLSETPIDGTKSPDYILGGGLNFVPGSDPSTFTITGLPDLPEGAVKFKIKPEDHNRLDIQPGTVFQGEDCNIGMTFPLNASGSGYSLATVDGNDKVVVFGYIPNPVVPANEE